jgi:S-(hydroxymethyl)glutathione dehydrogenase/alcohol dehydrogenase
MTTAGVSVRAAVWDGDRLTVVDDLFVRAPGPGEVSVDIEVAGLCHSDLNPILGLIEQDTPVVLGHEAVGVIAETGPGTTLRRGQRVVLSVLRNCGTCPSCRTGHRTRCRATSVAPPSPFTRHGATVHQFVRTGAFAQRTVVAAEQAIPIEENLPLPVAAMLGCATVTAFGAVEERARVQPGESVLVIGAGGVGLNVVLACRAAGAARILVLDRNPLKEAVARACGATDFAVTATADDVRQVAAAVASEGFDAAFECVGHPDLLASAVESLAWGGRCVIVGVPAAGARVTFPVRALFHDKALLGCRMGSVDPATALPRLAARVAAGELVLDPLVSTVVPLTDAATLVADLKAGRLDRGFLDLRAPQESSA